MTPRWLAVPTDAATAVEGGRRCGAPLPIDLRQWVVRHLPGLDTIVDASWPRGCSRVWRVASDTDEAYVKLGLTAPQQNPRAHGRRDLPRRTWWRWGRAERRA
ncbi:MAG: hypothetical protein ACRDRH_14830 [Pseudonocardia sp.]